MKRFFEDLNKVRQALEEPQIVETEREIGRLARQAGGRFRDIKSCMSSLDLEELAQIAGEAQDADGNFINRMETIGPNLREARSSSRFKQAQRNVLHQMEMEASV